MRKRLVLVPVGLAALFALALALAPADLLRAWGHVAEHPWVAVLALAAYTGAFVLRAFSWRPLAGVKVPVGKLFALLMGALFLNHAAPAKAGDVARAYALSRRGIPVEKVAVSVVLSRLVDLAGLLFVLAVCWLLAGAAGPNRGEAPVAAGAVVGVAAVFAVVIFFLARSRLPPSLAARFTPVARRASRVRAAMQETTWTALLQAFLFAAPAWVLEAGILLFVGWGLGLGLSPAEVVAATCFAVLVAAVPLAPGSLGTYEAGMVAVLLAFGVHAEPAFAAAVLTHAVKFLYALAAAPFALAEGLAAVVPKRKGRAEHAKSL